METPVHHTVSEALDELRDELRALYGDRLAHTVLFGSHARGEARPDSDVDVLVVLRGPISTYVEIKRLVPVAMGLWERYGLDVQLTPFSTERYADERHPLVMNVRREGRPLPL
jgi:predicted nucleotidyltransferase